MRPSLTSAASVVREVAAALAPWARALVESISVAFISVASISVASISVASCLVVGGAAGCGGSEERRVVGSLGAAPVRLRSPGIVPVDFVARQTVEATRGDRQVRFDAVFEKRGDAMLLVGLTPFGTRAFELVLRGSSPLAFTSHLSDPLPFPPERIALDVQRALFPALARTALPDGIHRGTVDGAAVVERWSGGALASRVWSVPEREGGGVADVRVEYDPPMRDFYPPTEVRVTHEGYGYRLLVHTSEVTRPTPNGTSPPLPETSGALPETDAVPSNVN